jgi:hypothetical protein
MINDEVINEIYKRYPKPVKDKASLNIPYYQELLQASNPIEVKDDMIIIQKIDEFSPFKRFLIRSLNAILEIDQMVAFVFNTHIVFMNKEENELRIHLKPERKKGLFRRLFKI